MLQLRYLGILEGHSSIMDGLYGERGIDGSILRMREMVIFCLCAFRALSVIGDVERVPDAIPMMTKPLSRMFERGSRGLIWRGHKVVDPAGTGLIFIKYVLLA